MYPDFKKMEPYVRYAHVSTNRMSAGVYVNPLYAYDHRMFYVLEGTIRLSIEGKGDRSLADGDGILFAPGLGYRVSFGSAPSRFVTVSFDFDDGGYGTKSRHPDTKERFCRAEIFSSYTPDMFREPYVCRGAFSVRHAVTDMCRAFGTDSAGKYDYASALMKSVIIEIYRLDGERARFSADSDTALRIKNYADDHCTENLTNRQIGRIFGYHPHYINQIFKRSAGETLRAYIIGKRISMAKNLLAGSALSSAAVGELCGFSSPSYFSECFKERTGMTASAYRQQCLKKPLSQE